MGLGCQVREQRARVLATHDHRSSNDIDAADCSATLHLAVSGWFSESVGGFQPAAIVAGHVAARCWRIYAKASQGKTKKEAGTGILTCLYGVSWHVDALSEVLTQDEGYIVGHKIFGLINLTKFVKVRRMLPYRSIHKPCS